VRRDFLAERFAEVASEVDSMTPQADHQIAKKNNLLVNRLPDRKRKPRHFEKKKIFAPELRYSLHSLDRLVSSAWQ
jgi:hypothetical protein